MIMSVLRYCFTIWILMVLVSCGNSTQTLTEGREFDSQTSPDGLMKAVVWLPGLGGLGATVSQPYQVWIQKLQGGEQKVLIFEADKTDGIGIRWKTQNELEVCYAQAQIVHFRNVFVVAERDSPEIYKVEIMLRRVSKLSDC